jgi:DNA-binding NarL/FixJ family response regulator
MLTTFDLNEYVYEALRAGASGFLLKDVPAEQLVAGVRVVAAGEALLAPSVTRRLRARPNAPEVIVLTTFDSDENVLRALRAGASGFLLKDSPPERIVDAIRRVASGDPILSPSVTRRLMERAAVEAGSYERARAALQGLSDRERDVALAVGQGRTNAEIAAELFMSVATVKAHISRILTKLDLGNRTQGALLVHDADLV